MTERRKTSTSKKIVENAYLRKPVLNNIMTTHTHTHTKKKCIKYNFLAPLTTQGIINVCLIRHVGKIIVHKKA